ncbi:MAG: DUF2877 domain-containing protein [Streptosporangiaceae bacterium]
MPGVAPLSRHAVGSPAGSQASKKAAVQLGAASTAVRPLVEGPRRPGRVLAAFPSATYVEVAGVAEPRVLAVVTSDAVRLPVAIVLGTRSHHHPPGGVAMGELVTVGGGLVQAGDARFLASRWWDPRVEPPKTSRRGLERALTTLRHTLERCGSRPGLGAHPTLETLASALAEGDLAGAVDSAERLVGLGPGLTPSGDDVLVGVLLALRLLGRGYTGGRRATMLADWLAAAVTSYADTRTTALAGSLLTCAARSQAAAEVTAVVRGLAAHETLEPAIRRLLAAGHTSGPDLACGLLVGGLAVLRLG